MDQAERQREYGRKRRADPAYRERQREYEKRYKRKRRADPAYQAARRAYMIGNRARGYQAKRDLVNALKSKPCTDCGKAYPPYVMDFDHRDPATKSFQIGNSVSARSVGALLDEIAKCDLVCANCHRQRTFIQRERPGALTPSLSASASLQLP